MLRSVRSTPHVGSSPALITASSSDDGGSTWLHGLRTWRFIQEHYELVKDAAS